MDSEELRLCRSCGIEKPVTSFFNYHGNPMPKCKSCFRDRVPIRSDLRLARSNVYKHNTKGIEKHAFNPTEKEFYRMYLLLRDLGYDLNEDISKQFCDKHGLNYTPRPKNDYINYKSAKDFGLV